MHDVAHAIFSIVKWLGKLRLPTISEPFHNGKDSSACGLFTSSSRWQRNRDPVYSRPGPVRGVARGINVCGSKCVDPDKIGL